MMRREVNIPKRKKNVCQKCECINVCKHRLELGIHLMCEYPDFRDYLQIKILKDGPMKSEEATKAFLVKVQSKTFRLGYECGILGELPDPKMKGNELYFEGMYLARWVWMTTGGLWDGYTQGELPLQKKEEPCTSSS